MDSFSPAVKPTPDAIFPAVSAPPPPRRRRPWRPLGIAATALFALALLAPFLLPLRSTSGSVPARERAGKDALFASIDGVDVRYTVRGRGEPAVVLFHGFGASVFSWREVLAPLGRTRRVVAFDRPGFGMSGRPMPEERTGDNPYTSTFAADLTIELLDHLGIGRAVLVGHSAGAAVAVLAAARHSGRVAGLILVAPALEDPPLAWLPGPLLRSPQMRRLGPRLVRASAGRGAELLREAWHDRWRVTPDLIEGYTEPLEVTNWERALWEIVAARERIDAKGVLASLDLPVLFVAGDDDRIVPSANCRELSALHPGAGCLEIGSAGHLPHEERPAEFLRTIEPFLAGLAPPTS